jgi:pimeloyl-ACP methyl ester carboxylesterase
MSVPLLTLSDGRQFEYHAAGNPDGPTVLFHHGTPGCVTTAETLFGHRDDLYVVSYSRAGYGASARHEGRRVADVVADTRAVLDHLGRNTYVTVGWSGGGPHALACAALDTPRCTGALSLAGVVPMDVDFDWTAGMGEENIEEFRVAAEGGPEYEAHMANAGESFRGATADNIFELFGSLLPPVDREAIERTNGREAMARDMAYAFHDGHWGFYDDDRAFFASWGFDPTTIRVPVALFYGDGDAMVPPSHGDWLRDHVPTAKATFVPGAGHISVVVDHLDEIIRVISTFA